ncbi:sperm-tail PG-rich repeat-containing protein 2 isoform D [Alligator mississippiensis]|uniref:Sperm-tail PG-rich repeat-containing protein 2 isoform D n=1 Tax=Alligator mississippiensis TaxID=8496 RepID=A0A151NMI0_ALLMI|nr:sperm-tail PG-rich repeat-containing protein 2 isoform D [Alligator mississippiensis]
MALQSYKVRPQTLARVEERLFVLHYGYAPFLSLTSRNLAFTIQNTDVNVPGPGHYDIAKIQGEGWVISLPWPGINSAVGHRHFAFGHQKTYMRQPKLRREKRKEPDS